MNDVLLIDEWVTINLRGGDFFPVEGYVTGMNGVAIRVFSEEEGTRVSPWASVMTIDVSK